MTSPGRVRDSTLYRVLHRRRCSKRRNLGDLKETIIMINCEPKKGNVEGKLKVDDFKSNKLFFFILSTDFFCRALRRAITFTLMLSFMASLGCVSSGKRYGEVGSNNGLTISGESLAQSEGGAKVGISKEIPVVVNTKVKFWIHYFQKKGRRHMTKYLQRSTRYEKLMKDILRAEGLPEDLIYVPLIESGFSSQAHSHRSAVGYWQFIRPTGLRYGLKIDRYVDDRSDPLLSTRAAAAYFKSLYSLFGDWYLALAAYNTGENRVKRAVMREGSRDFWVLARKRRLHRETRNYVPKFLAAMLISESPEKYGFSDVEYKPPLKYNEVYTKHPVSLLKLSRHIGVSVDSLRRLNTRYRTDYIPIYRGKPSLIRVPEGYTLVAHQALLKSRSKAPRYAPPMGKKHIVRRGDTLSGIALRYGVRVSDLRAMNNLGRRSFIRIGQRLKIGRATVSRRSSKRKPSSSGYYVVRRGDTLSEIALRYGLSIRELMRINKIKRGSFLRVGQRLSLRQKKKSSKKTGNRFVHIVKRGDTLWELAQKYNVSLRELRAANSLSVRSKLQIGKSLIVP